MKHTKSLTQIASVHGHLPGEDETDNKFKVLFEQEQKDRIKWQEEAKKWEALFDKMHDEITFEIGRDSNGPTEEPERCIRRVIQERDQLRAENSALKLQLEEGGQALETIGYLVCALREAWCGS